MTTEQIINTLREYNAWRRDGESEMLDPKLIGKTIDAACDMMETMQRERDEAIAARKASAANWLLTGLPRAGRSSGGSQKPQG